MQKKLIGFIKLIFRDSENLTFENKILNRTSFIIFLSTTAVEILNIIIGLHIVAHVATFMGIICSAVIYFLSKNSKYHSKLTILICVYFIFLFTFVMIILWLISIDYFISSSIIKYTDNSQKFLDKSCGLIVSFLKVGAMMLLVFLQYVKERERMEKAIEEIKTLKGFIPICANCKGIIKDYYSG